MSTRSSGSQTVCNVHPLRRPSHSKSNLSFTLSLSLSLRPSRLLHSTSGQQKAILFHCKGWPTKQHSWWIPQSFRRKHASSAEIWSKPLARGDSVRSSYANTATEGAAGESRWFSRNVSGNKHILSFPMTIFNAHRELVWFAFTCLRIITKIKPCRNAKILTLTKKSWDG